MEERGTHVTMKVVMKMTPWLLLLFISVEGQVSFTPEVEFPNKNGQTEGDFCNLRSGVSGTCVPVRKCRQDVSSLMTSGICSYDKFMPIVCCPRNKIITGATETSFAPVPIPPMQYETTPSSSEPQQPIFTAVGERSKRACEEYKAMAKQFASSSRNNDGTSQFVEPTHLPHMVLIGFGKQSKIYWRCSGALISPSFVIAPGHCVASRRHGAVKWVMVGVVDPHDSTLPAHSQVFAIERIAHPGFKPPSLHDDLSLLKLETEAILGPHVRPACISSLKAKPGLVGTVPGWELNNWIIMPGKSHLMVSTMEVLPDEVCAEAYKFQSRLKGSYNNEKMMCFGNNQGPTADCERDTGGPFHTQTADKVFTIYAVTLFGNTVCERRNNTPVISTDVAEYMPWIEDHVWPIEVSVQRVAEPGSLG